MPKHRPVLRLRSIDSLVVCLLAPPSRAPPASAVSALDAPVFCIFYLHFSPPKMRLSKSAENLKTQRAACEERRCSFDDKFSAAHLVDTVSKGGGRVRPGFEPCFDKFKTGFAFDLPGRRAVQLQNRQEQASGKRQHLASRLPEELGPDRALRRPAGRCRSTCRPA